MIGAELVLIELCRIEIAFCSFKLQLDVVLIELCRIEIRQGEATYAVEQVF